MDTRFRGLSSFSVSYKRSLIWIIVLLSVAMGSSAVAGPLNTPQGELSFRKTGEFSVSVMVGKNKALEVNNGEAVGIHHFGILTQGNKQTAVIVLAMGGPRVCPVSIEIIVVAEKVVTTQAGDCYSYPSVTQSRGTFRIDFPDGFRTTKSWELISGVMREVPFRADGPQQSPQRK